MKNLISNAETYTEYKNRFFNSDHNYFSKRSILYKINLYKEQLKSLNSGHTRPSEIIGAGYKNPKECATRSLKSWIADFESRLKNEGDCQVLRINYEIIFKRVNKALN